MRSLAFNYIKLYYDNKNQSNSFRFGDDNLLEYLSICSYPDTHENVPWEFVSITYNSIILVDRKDVK